MEPQFSVSEIGILGGKSITPLLCGQGKSTVSDFKRNNHSVSFNERHVPAQCLLSTLLLMFH